MRQSGDGERASSDGRARAVFVPKTSGRGSPAQALAPSSESDRVPSSSSDACSSSSCASPPPRLAGLKRWCWAHTNAKRIRVTVKVSPSSSMAAVERAVTSKSFRAILPNASADDVTKLRRYCAENFAASVVFVDSA